MKSKQLLDETCHFIEKNGKDPDKIIITKKAADKIAQEYTYYDQYAKWVNHTRFNGIEVDVVNKIVSRKEDIEWILIG
jgi:hypothetical protein